MKKVLTLMLALAFAGISSAQSDIQKTKETVFKNDIEGHIYFLASDELRGRNTGSPEIDIAASYLANSFRRYGVKPINGSYYQDVKLQTTKAPQKLSITLNTASSSDLIQLKGYNTNFNGNAIYLNYGTEADFKGKNIKDKLIIVKTGTPESNDTRTAIIAGRKKMELAKKNGALGLLELSNTETNVWNSLKSYFMGDKLGFADTSSKKSLHLWLKDTDGSIAKQLEKSKKITTNLTIEGIEKNLIKAKNVVGMVEGSDPKLKDEFIIYSAHYDHIGVGKPNQENDSIYNGARDNAVGVVTVLSAAENIAKYPTKRSALFILFTAEEKGLLGSKWYVENPLIPLEKMVYCFNSDNGGYNDTSIATIIGLNRTTADKHITKATAEFGLVATNDPSPEQGLFDRSDNVNFAAKGIPAPTFSLGFTAFDAEIGKYYHQPSDNPDNLDYDYLEKFFKSYVLACRLIANDPVTPYWVKGDKYYQAGEELYKRKPIKK